MINVLWFSNAVLSANDCRTSGTWLAAMSQRLLETDEVSLANVSSDRVGSVGRHDAGPIRQWLVPIAKLGRDGLPPSRLLGEIVQVVDQCRPDLVHVWGVESYWGLLIARGHIVRPALLEMQGLKGAIATTYAGGLTRQEQRHCIGLKEWLMHRSIEREAKKYEEWGQIEDEIIAGFRLIVAQTPWVEARVRAVNPSCLILHNDLMLRPNFYDAVRWVLPERGPVLFCSAAYPAPFKGLHDAVRAVALVAKVFPTVRLRIAGAQQRPGWRQEGYVRWLNRLCVEVGIAGQVDWLGPLTAGQVVLELQKANAFIMPSHMENCSTSMQEAMMVGTPIVASYAGGLPSLATNEKSALFYPPGDEVMCAWQIQRVLTNEGLARELSCNAIEMARVRNCFQTVVSRQLTNYRQVVDQTTKTIG